MCNLRVAVNERGVKIVWHFTRLANLPGILNEGLVPRETLEFRPVPPDFNDAYRYDMQKNAICCSIGHPNYKMFYSLRQQHNEEWVVCALNPSILWEKDCAFCVKNAASNSVTCIPLEERCTVNAFDSMFNEIDGKPARSALGIPDSCPTNPQAEVLVLDAIEPEYIVGAGCNSITTRDALREEYEAFQFIHAPGLFSARKDFANW